MCQPGPELEVPLSLDPGKEGRLYGVRAGSIMKPALQNAARQRLCAPQHNIDQYSGTADCQQMQRLSARRKAARLQRCNSRLWRKTVAHQRGRPEC